MGLALQRTTIDGNLEFSGYLEWRKQDFERRKRKSEEKSGRTRAEISAFGKWKIGINSDEHEFTRPFGTSRKRQSRKNLKFGAIVGQVKLSFESKLLTNKQKVIDAYKEQARGF